MTTFEKIIKYTATAFAAILAVGIVVFILNIGLYIISSASGGTECTDKSYTINAEHLTSIYIDNAAADVTIDYYSEEKISLEAYDVPKNFKWNLQDDILHIKNSNFKTAFLPFSNNKPKIILHLPKDYKLQELTLKGGVGNVNIQELFIHTLTIHGGVGDINASNLSINKFIFNGGVGDFNMKKCSVDNIELDGGIGDIDIENSILKDIEIDNGIGDIDIDINGDIEDYSFDMDGGLGEIKINNKKPGYYKDNDGKYEISCDNGIGDIDITIK